jgi:hypothetical protein
LSFVPAAVNAQLPGHGQAGFPEKRIFPGTAQFDTYEKPVSRPRSRTYPFNLISRASQFRHFAPSLLPSFTVSRTVLNTRRS